VKRLDRFDPIAVLDKVNELVDFANAAKGSPTIPDKEPPAADRTPRKTVGPRQVAITESLEFKPSEAPKKDETAVGSYTNRAEAALNVAINRLVELKDTATVERIHRIWRRN